MRGRGVNAARLFYHAGGMRLLTTLITGSGNDYSMRLMS